MLVRILVVVGVVIAALVGVVGRRRAVSVRSAPRAVTMSLLAPASVVAPFFVNLLLLVWRKEATWDFFEESVGDLLRTVVEGFKHQYRHLSARHGAGAQFSKYVDVETQRGVVAAACDWSTGVGW